MPPSNAEQEDQRWVLAPFCHIQLLFYPSLASLNLQLKFKAIVRSRVPFPGILHSIPNQPTPPWRTGMAMSQSIMTSAATPSLKSTPQTVLADPTVTATANVLRPKLTFVVGASHKNVRLPSVQFAPNVDSRQRPASPKPHPSQFNQRRMTSPPPPS